MPVLVNKAYKTELNPTPEQRILFAKCAGIARFIYNWGLDNSNENGKRISIRTLRKMLNVIKYEKFPWMLEVLYKLLQYSLGHLDNAFKNYYRNLHDKKEKKGYPKKKTRKCGRGNFSLDGTIIVEVSRIRLPRIGWVELKEVNYIPTNIRIKLVTISERADRWFISANLEENITIPENKSNGAIGIDVGLNTFAVGSNDTYNCKAPKPLRKKLKRLQRLSQAHSRKQKGSKNREKSRKKLAKLHFKISCIREDFLHKESTKLAKTKSVIVVENLDIQEMVKNPDYARSISDASWGKFTSYLSYKCKWYGSVLLKADKFFPSSKLCSNCGCKKKKLGINIRTYCCKMCGLVIDRDLNAARNLVNIYYLYLVAFYCTYLGFLSLPFGSTESHACLNKQE